MSTATRRRLWIVAGVFALATLSAGKQLLPTTPTPTPVAIAPVAAPPVKAAATPIETPTTPVKPVGSLAVRVTANGAAIANAEVSVTDGSRPTLATTMTDREGMARFKDLQPGAYELWARHDAMVSPLARIGDLAAAQDVALALAPATTLRGQLTGDIPGEATITLIPIDVDHVARIATADAKGAFSIEGVPAGHWRASSSAVGRVQQGDQTIDVHGDHGEVALAMVRTGVASGTVMDGNGEPVANATIVLRRQGTQLEEQPTIESAVKLRWVHPLAGRRILPTSDVLRFGAPRPGARPAECGQGHCGVDIGWIRGTVIHAAADGEIVLAYTESHGEAGRSIAIDHGDGIKSYYMHLDELRAGLEIGQKVRAGDALGAMGSTGFATGPHLHFALTQERGGRTWYVDPEPILRHAVVLPEPRTLDPIDARDAPVIAAARREPGTHTITRTFTTDNRGHFRIDNVAPGGYVAVAFASELAPGTSNAFTIQSGGETGDVAIALHPGVLVQGRVIGRDGPIAGASIVAGAGGGETAHKVAAANTSHQGDFALRALSGSITLAVTAPGYGVIERTITLGDRGPAHREDFNLMIENAQLRGQVLAPDGGSAGRVTLRVVEGPTRRQTTTDASGRFTIDHAAAGAYVLEVVSPDYPTTRINAQTDQWVDARLVRGGGLRIDLRDGSSASSLVGVQIDATGPGDREATAITDGNGIATLRALVIGDWSLRIRAKGFSETRRAINIRAGAQPEDLRLSLSRGVTLAGVVRDRRGHRVAGARVFTDGATTQTDAEGKFRLVDAPAGTYALEAELDGARGQVQLQLSPGSERMTVDIELSN